MQKSILEYSLQILTICTGLVMTLVVSGCDMGGINYSLKNGNGSGSQSTPNNGNSTWTSNGSGMLVGIYINPSSQAVSAYSLSNTDYWSQAAKTLAQLVPNSTPTAVIVAGTNTKGACTLFMPEPSSKSNDDKTILFSNDSLDPILTAFDNIGGSVILEVQPGYAPLDQIISALINQYSGHSSLAGISIDARYSGVQAVSNDAYLSDADATTALSSLQSLGSNYSLYLKSASSSNLPTETRTSMTFVSDAAKFSGSDTMLASLSNWASNFSPSSIQVDIGAVADQNWWCASQDATAVMSDLLGAISALQLNNLTGLFWDADGFVKLVPKVTCAPATALTTGTSSATTGSTTQTTTTSGHTTAGTGGTTSGLTITGGTTLGTTTAGSTTASTATAGSTTASTATAGSTSVGTATAGSTTASTATAGTTSAGTATAGSTTSSTGTAGTTTAGTTAGTTGATTSETGTTTQGF